MARRRLVGRLFVISSPSGGGKTTVVSRLRRRWPRLVRSVSVTTRPPRRGEQRGHAYHFVSLRAFEQLRRSGRLLEWAKVHGAYYGTPKRPILQALARGQDVLLSIDVQGARQVRRAMGRRAVLIFLVPPSLEELRRRLTRRQTETAEAIRRRLIVARRELASARWYDYRVVNERLAETVKVVGGIMTRPTSQSRQ